MIVNLNEQVRKTNHLPPKVPRKEPTKNLATIENNPLYSQLLLSKQIIVHNAKAGLNPLVDAAAPLFSLLGRLQHLQLHADLPELQQELLLEINSFQLNIKNIGYNSEYLIICRYIICALFDEIISATSWGGDKWQAHSLLVAHHQNVTTDKFFIVLDRALKEPTIYIDVMEFMYLCLNMGYEGRYKTAPDGAFELKQITNNLYNHIRAYRGNFSKALSPSHLKRTTTNVTKKKFPTYLLFFVAGTLILSVFLCLSYIMDTISNEAYQHIAAIKKPSIYSTQA